jgi:hypothetical protein
MVMLVKLPSLVGLLLRVSMTGSKDSGSPRISAVVDVVVSVAVETSALCNPRTCHMGISVSTSVVVVDEGGGDAGVVSGGSETFCDSVVVVVDSFELE